MTVHEHPTRTGAARLLAAILALPDTPVDAPLGLCDHDTELAEVEAALAHLTVKETGR